MDTTLHTIRILGQSGWIVSVCYGPCGRLGLQWSVDMMHPQFGIDMDQPVVANSWEHLAEVMADLSAKLLEERKQD